MLFIYMFCTGKNLQHTNMYFSFDVFISNALQFINLHEDVQPIFVVVQEINSTALISVTVRTLFAPTLMHILPELINEDFDIELVLVYT